MGQKKEAITHGVAAVLVSSYVIMWLRTIGLLGIWPTIWGMGSTGILGGLITSNSVDSDRRNQLLYGGLAGVVAVIVWTAIFLIIVGLETIDVTPFEFPIISTITDYLVSFHILGAVFLPLSAVAIAVGGILGSITYGIFGEIFGT